MTGLRVQIASFNANLQGAETLRPDLTPWLIPTVKQAPFDGTASSSKTPLPAESYASSNPKTPSSHPSLPRDATDFYAVGFQELVPLHLGFAANHETALYNTDLDIRKTVRPHQAVVSGNGMYAPTEQGGGPESYALLCKVDLVGIALFVYARERASFKSSGKPAAARVKEIRKSTVGTGLGSVMGNKGGVGVRIVVEAQDGRGPDEVLTFICAHLTAHDHNVPRRNADWKQIVQRMVFAPSTAVKLPIVQKPTSKPTSTNLDALKDQYESSKAGKSTSKRLAIDDASYTIYDTTHLFVFGDLNHRIALGPSEVAGSNEKAGALTKKGLADVLESGDWKALQPYDQLSSQRLASPAKAFHGLTELSIDEMGVPPTYKYKVVREGKKQKKEKKGTLTSDALGGQELSKKRIPGWTDRVLWASAPAASEEKADPFGKQGVQLELFRSVMEMIHSDHKPVTTLLRLPTPTSGTPFLTSLNPYTPLSSTQRDLLRLVGVLLDRIVGYLWSAVILLGGGNLVGGLVELAVLGGIAAWWLSRGGVPGDLDWRLFTARQ